MTLFISFIIYIYFFFPYKDHEGYVTKVETEDSDLGANGNVTYKFSEFGSEDYTNFDLDLITGVIEILYATDRETQELYTVSTSWCIHAMVWY